MTVKSPIDHPNWSTVETLSGVLANFNLADTSLALSRENGGPDGKGTAYHHVERAILAALVEIFEWAGFGQPVMWASEVQRLSVESGESFAYTYRYILDHGSVPVTLVDESKNDDKFASVVVNWDDAGDVHMVAPYAKMHSDSDAFKDHGPVTDGYSVGTTARCGTYVYGVARSYSTREARRMVTCPECK